MKKIFLRQLVWWNLFRILSNDVKVLPTEESVGLMLSKLKYLVGILSPLSLTGVAGPLSYSYMGTWIWITLVVLMWHTLVLHLMLVLVLVGTKIICVGPMALYIGAKLSIFNGF